MPMKEVDLLFSYLDVKLFYFLIQIAIGVFIFSYIKETMNLLVSFIMFKSNKYVCVGRKVIVNGFKGNITHIGFQFIIIKNKERTLMIQTIRWRYEKWEFEEVGDD